MFATRLLCYPWDLVDEGVEKALDVIRGDLGVDGITVVVGTGPVTVLRRRPEASPRVLHSRGGLLFQPQDEAYHSTRCKPPVSGWLKARNPLARIARACVQHGLKLRAALDTRRIGRLATRYPIVAVKSAFDEPAPNCACLANPDFAELLHALIGDLFANYAICGLELRGLDTPFDSDLLDNAPGADMLGPAGRELLSVCFCESSMQSALKAEIDAEAARRSARVTLSRAIENGRSLGDSLDGILTDDPILQCYVEHQRHAHRSVLASLAGRAGGPLAMEVQTDRRASEVVEAMAAGSLSALITPVSTSHETAGHGPADLLGLFGGGDTPECEALVRVGEATDPDGVAVVRTLKLLVDAGWHAVTVSHFGSMGPLELRAVKQAARFARRSAND
jgi:hypothetical protein